MRVRPSVGKLVRDPVSLMLLPVEGCNVPDNTFWRRRLMDGDVVRVIETDPELEPEPKMKKTTKR